MEKRGAKDESTVFTRVTETGNGVGILGLGWEKMRCLILNMLSVRGFLDLHSSGDCHMGRWRHTSRNEEQNLDGRDAFGAHEPTSVCEVVGLVLSARGECW